MNSSIWDRLQADAAIYPMMYGHGVEMAEIEKAQIELKVTFDNDYIRFLKEYGGAMLGANPIFGLQKAEVMGTDAWSVVDVTQRFRNEGWVGVEKWYIISIDGAGNPVGTAPDGAIYLSDHHGGGIIEVADNFILYLEKLTGIG